MFKGTDIIEFSNKFQKEEDCLKYLAKLKWRKGYTCSKCSNSNYCPGRKYLVRRCTRCKYEESVTAGTVFHKLKFPLVKAFYIVFLVSTSKKGISSYELSRKLSLRQPTCWLFKRKIMEVMNKSINGILITGKVQVDEFVIGGPEEEKRGRSHGKKKLVIAAVQYDKKGIFKVISKVINDSGTKSIKPFFQDHISVLSKVKTDKWRGYRPLARIYDLKQTESKKGKGMPEFHRYVMSLKSWIRGIHHHCSKQHLQAYLNEFNFRFNHANSDTLFYKIQNLMLNHKPVFYKFLSAT